MTKEKAFEIANNHVMYLKEGEISRYDFSDGTHIQIMTIYEPDYYDDSALVCYIDHEDEDGDAIETHTTYPADVKQIAFWIYEMCWNLEEK